MRLHQFNNNIPDICTKCEQYSKGTLFHCMWECKEIATFWCEISQIIHKMLDVKIPLDPKLFILGLYPSTPVITKNKMNLINMCLLQAKRSIALSWKNTQRPHVGQWLREMSNCCSMEKITYILKRKNETYCMIGFGARLLNC